MNHHIKDKAWQIIVFCTTLGWDSSAAHYLRIYRMMEEMDFWVDINLEEVVCEDLQSQ